MKQYTFTQNENETVLRIKSDCEITLVPGFHRIVEKQPDSEIIHSFELCNEIKRDEKNDAFYVWYSVGNYHRDIEKKPEALNKLRADIDYISMMTDVEIPEEVIPDES